MCRRFDLLWRVVPLDRFPLDRYNLPGTCLTAGIVRGCVIPWRQKLRNVVDHSTPRFGLGVTNRSHIEIVVTSSLRCGLAVAGLFVEIRLGRCLGN